MLSLETILEPVKTALLTVTNNVGHHFADDTTQSYITYQEQMEAESVANDNVKSNQGIHGIIDLYAKVSDMAMFDQVQTALNNAEISFTFSDSTFDEGRNMIHYQWDFEVF